MTLPTVPLRHWREKIVKASQRALADKMGVSAVTISRWEAHPDREWRRLPTIEHVMVLQRVSNGAVNAESFDADFLRRWEAENAQA